MARLKIILLVSLFCFCLPQCNTRSKTNKQISDSNEKHLADSAKYHEGQLTFRKYCNTCHVAPERNVTDQYLFDNLFERLPSPAEQYFIKYIQDSKSLKSSGDKYAINLDKTWSQDYEHNFKDSLSQSNFSDLITYIKEAAKLKYQ
jgi:cytochrome c2